MYSKSSTFLALTSILAILAVLSIAINNVQDAPVRRPFSSLAKETGNESEIGNLPGGWDNLTKSQQTEKLIETSPIGESAEKSADEQIINNELKFTAEDQKYFQENFKNLDTSVMKLNFEDGSLTSNEAPKQENLVKIDSNLNKLLTNTNSSTSNNNDQLIKNVNNELLRKVGYVNFVIKPKPFNGKIFDKFDISILGALNIIEKDVLEDTQSQIIKSLEVYEFSLGSKETAQEIYDFLKAKIKDELGVTINETNQFGLSSFYINLGEATDRAFLVVKMRDNVYALSYPKAKSTEKDYFGLTSALLKELI